MVIDEILAEFSKQNKVLLPDTSWPRYNGQIVGYKGNGIVIYKSRSVGATTLLVETWEKEQRKNSILATWPLAYYGA